MLNHAAGHDRNAVGNGHRLFLIVGDIDRRNADAVLNLADGVSHLDAQLRVEVGKRLIHQQHVRLDDNRAGERDALLLAAGKALRQTVGILRDLHGLQNLVHALLDLFLGQMAVFKAESDVLAHGHMRENGVILENHADVALVRRNIVDDLAVESDGAALDGVKARNHAQQGRFAAAGRAEQREELALLDIQIQIGDDDVLAIFLDDVLKMNAYAHIR